MPDEKKELCTIRIMFPADTDDEAVNIKKKIAEILKDKPDTTIQFGLSTMPTKMPM